MHPQDLLAMVFHTQASPNNPITRFTTAHTRSFVRMWEPVQQQQPTQKGGPVTAAASMLAGLKRAILGL